MIFIVDINDLRSPCPPLTMIVSSSASVTA
jgi:hypothetical protein